VGGFQGGDALLAFAAIQQGRMNEEMSESMRVADLRSQMAGDLADIKSHLEIANRHPENYGDLNAELKAFMDKYGGEPELEAVTSTVGEIADNVNSRYTPIAEQNRDNASGFAAEHARWVSEGSKGDEPQPGTPVVMGKYADETIKNWLGAISEQLDASGTNDQLAMIHIKQLNDNINNSSGMVSGIIESRNNATASIINNIA
jgi:hypothetical protein